MKNLLGIGLLLLSSCVTLQPAQSTALSGVTFTYGYSMEPDRVVPVSEVIHFACYEYVNKRYLLNKKGTKVCWIKNPSDYELILKGLGLTYVAEKTITGSNCPTSFEAPEYCDPKKLRSF